MNNGHGGSGGGLTRRGPARMSNIDMYRKIPSDLMEGTKRGSFLSYMCLVFMVTLFTFETRAFFKTDTVTDIALDTNPEETLRLNFNITMMDLKCDHTVVDVVSVLGTDQNITAHVTKWHVDADGIRQRYQGRNKQQSTIELSDEAVTQTIEELHEDGEDAIELDEETFEYAKNEYEYLFVDFYANWCSHCRDLAPTWETLAEVMTDAMNHAFEEKHGDKKHDYSEEEEEMAKSVELPVMVAKVDCVHYPKLCQEQRLVAYPTLRMFVDGERWPKEYNGHRRVVDMVKWLAEVEEEHKSELTGDAENEVNRKVQVAHEKALERMKVENKPQQQARFAEEIKRKKNKGKSATSTKKVWNDEEHPGCQLAGYLKLPRAPGNFHIQARSPHHDLIPHMTNVSHIIHHLSIGEPLMERRLEKLGVVPENAKMKFSPMNGNVYVTHELHQAHHHYLKVITTSADKDKMAKESYSRFVKSSIYAYQILQNSQLSFYSEDIVPEAKFIYDLSPIAISYRSKSRHWYDYLTSIMAIIGGAFTVFGMVESAIHATLSRAKRRF